MCIHVLGRHFISLIWLEECNESVLAVITEVEGPLTGPSDGNCSGLTRSEYYGFFPTTVPCWKHVFAGLLLKRWSEVVEGKAGRQAGIKTLWTQVVMHPMQVLFIPRHLAPGRWVVS